MHVAKAVPVSALRKIKKKKKIWKITKPAEEKRKKITKRNSSRSRLNEMRKVLFNAVFRHDVNQHPKHPLQYTVPTL